MWKASKKIVEIFNNLEIRGYNKEIPQSIFIHEFMRTTDITTQEPINRYLKVFRDLGYIKVVSPGLLERCIDVNRPYDFGDK